MPSFGQNPIQQRRKRQDAINLERNRRINLGFGFGGHWFDFDDLSRARIAGMGTLAGFAIGQGAQPGDLFWHGEAEPFAWTTAINEQFPMDAHTMFAFARASAAHEASVLRSARNLKDMADIPADFEDNKHWS